MKHEKLFAQRTGLVALANFIQNFKGVLLLPILTKNMPLEDYGVWALISVTIGIIPNIASLGYPSVLVRFLPSAKDKEQIKKLFYSSLSIVIISGLFCAFLLYMISNYLIKNSFAGNQFIANIFIIIIFFETIQKVLLSYFRATQQIKKHSFISLLKSLLLLIFVGAFVFQGKGLIGAINGLFLETTIILILSLFIIVSHLGLSIPSFSGIGVYIKYGIPTVPGSTSRWIVNSSDRYVIGGLLGSSSVGYYSPGYALGSIIQMFFQPLNFMLPMVTSKYYDENNFELVKKYLSFSLKYYMAIAIPAAFGISFLSKALLVILSTPEIAEKGYLITPFVALSMIFYGLFSIFQKVMLLLKKTHVLGTMWIFVAALNLLLNILLIPHFGIIAAAATTLLSFGTAVVFAAHYTLKFLKIDINLKFILKSIFASILMAGIIVFWDPKSIISILIACIVCAMFYTTLMLLLKGFENNEILFIKNLIMHK